MALDGDIAAQVLIVGAIDLAHPARADLLQDAVVADCLANHGKVPRQLGPS